MACNRLDMLLFLHVHGETSFVRIEMQLGEPGDDEGEDEVEWAVFGFMFVLALTNISSPGPRPAACTAKCKADVPLLTAMPCRHPQYAANLFSNSSRATPKEPDISPRRRAATTASISSSSMSGSKTGIMFIDARRLYQTRHRGKAPA